MVRKQDVIISDSRPIYIFLRLSICNILLCSFTEKSRKEVFNERLKKEKDNWKTDYSENIFLLTLFFSYI